MQLPKTFDLHIGIDYSGRESPLSRTSALQVYAASDREEPSRIMSPACTAGKRRNWCRKEVAEWLIEQARKDITFIAGIDHGFSFPINYFERYKLKSWEHFMDDFCEHWPTDEDRTHVDSIRKHQDGPPDRTGSNKDFRLTEKWTSSAKSVFQFDVQGSVAKSTHAGLPWLQRIRTEVGDKLHVWPFDGWQVPEGKSVIAEVYPSIFRNRYSREERSVDQQDAYCVARWLAETDRQGFLDQYFLPPLADETRKVASLEGWILGVM